MSLIQALILGVVEGITEFLPISSTAHLIITSEIFHLPQNAFVSFFEVFIQSGAILAVILLYWRLVLKHKEFVYKVLVSFIPTAIIGLLMRDMIKNVFFQSISMIGLSLIIVGILFMVLEYFVREGAIKLTKKLTAMTYQEAFIIGCIQAFAIIPGVSRAGAVMIGLMAMKYKRSEAAIYSFLLAVPTLVGASVFDLVKTDTSFFSGADFTALFIGFIVSFASALVFIKWLIGYLQKNTLNAFAIYRILVGLGVLFFLG